MNTTTEIDPTQKALIEMLTENTGTHMLDSGGAHGRHWQHNQAHDFLNEPRATMETWSDSFTVTVSLFHFLHDRVEYEPELTQALHEFGEGNDDAWLVSMEEWVESRDAEHDVGGVYGDGKPATVNTYNHESSLTQTIQYTYWTEDAGQRAYIALQIHGGCDVRGGYTKPRVFSVSETEMFDNACSNVVCSECHAGWYTDDAYHWYQMNNEGDLSAFTFVAAEDDKEGPRKGVVVIGKDSVSCPCCGTGNLNPSPASAG